MTTEKETLFRELESLLKDPRQASNGRLWSFCPCHPDGSKSGRRSLSLSPRYGLQCFAGCDFKAILEALRGRRIEGRNNGSPSEGKLIATYEYRDETGKLIAEKSRIEYPDGKKSFRWRLPGGTWADGLGQTMKARDLPLYGAENAASAKVEERVWFVEGEKAQRALVLHDALAVTHGGGASTRDFGKSLDILKGRTVILWADNDPPGREYMTALFARLQGIAQEVSYFTCPTALPEKGDAHDYFERGGTMEALVASLSATASPKEPITELMADDAVRVTIPSASGPIRFDFSAIDTSARRFDAELTITFAGGGEPYFDRVNLFSATQRTELRRELDGLYGKELEWTKLLNKAWGLARQFYMGMDRALDVSEAPIQVRDRFAVDPLLPMDAATICFGDGSASKTMIACAVAAAFTTGERVLGMGTPGLPVLFVDWEDTFSTFARRIQRIGGGTEVLLGRKRLQYWPGRGIPLSQQLDAIKSKVQQDGIGLIIIDSVALACGGPPEDSTIANAFFNSLKRIGVTAMCIAHVTKKGDDDKPFGSAFWHNSARRTWLIKKATEDEESSVLDVAIINKKVNDGPKPKSIPVRIMFDDPDGRIILELGKFEVTSELSKAAMSRSSRIWLALKNAQLTSLELAAILEEKDDHAIRTELNRNKEAFTKVGLKWTLVERRFKE